MKAANLAHRMGRRPNRVARLGVYGGLAASLLVARAWARQENTTAAQAETSSRNSKAHLSPTYALEERFLPDQVSKLVFDLAVTPHWFSESDRVWYGYETPEGTRYHLVDPSRKARTPLWDNAKVAALSVLTNFPYDTQHLPVKQLKLVDKDTRMRFEVEIRKTRSCQTNQKGKRARRTSRSRAKKERGGRESRNPGQLRHGSGCHRAAKAETGDAEQEVQRVGDERARQPLAAHTGIRKKGTARWESP